MTIVVGLCLVLLTTSTVVTSLLSRQATQDQLSQLTSDADLTSDYVAASLSGLQDVVHAWAGRSQVITVAESARGGAVPAAEFADGLRLTQSLQLARDGVATAFIVDAGGRSLANAPLNRAALGKNFSSREWFRGAVNTRAPYLTSAYRSVSAGRPWVVAAASPIFAADGSRRLVGVVVATYPLSTLQGFAQHYGTGHGGTLVISDAQGQILAVTGHPTGGTVLARDQLTSRLARGPARVRYGDGVKGEDAFAATHRVGPFGWSVVVSQPVSVALTSTNRMLWAVRLLTLLLAVVASAGTLAWRRRARRQRAALTQAQERFRALYAATPTGNVELDLEQRVLHCNAVFAAMVGVEESEVVGRYGYEFLHRDGPPPDFVGLAALRNGTVTTHTGERLLARADGTVLPVVLNWSAIRDDSGAAASFVCVVTDITVQAAAQAEAQARQLEYGQALIDLAAANEELARRQSFLDAVLETVDVGIVCCDAAGGTLIRNRAERDMVGLDAAHHGIPPETASAIIDVLDADGNRLPVESYPLMRTLRGEDTGAVEVKLGPPGGPHREVVVRGTQITGSDGEVLGAVVSLTDVTAERTAARALVEEHRQLTEAQRLGQFGSFSYEPVGQTFTVSDQLLQIWGAPAGADLAQLWADVIYEDDRDGARINWERACAAGGRTAYEYRIVRSDGQVRHLRSDIEAICDEQGEVTLVQGTQLDITDLVAARDSMQQANAFFQAVLAATPDYTYIRDVDTGELIWGTDRMSVLGISSQELEAFGAEAVAALVHPNDQQVVRADSVAARELADGDVMQSRYRALHADGQWHWLSRRLTPFRRNAAGAVTQVLGIARDVTDIVQAEEELTSAALHDPLTGLPNRALLIDRLNTALSRSERDHREIAVLYCDLDGFKQVNDTGGHAAGDAVLLETARRLSAALREHDTVARVGGDEFVIVVEPWNRTSLSTPSIEDDRAVALLVAERVATTLCQPITVDGVEYTISASIGITHPSLPTAGQVLPLTADQVLGEADAAMYRAKTNGKARYEVFEREGRPAAAEEERIQLALRSALNHAGDPPWEAAIPHPRRHGVPRLVPTYQPVLDATTRWLLGFEAQVQLIDADGFEVDPDALISAAERLGMMRQLREVVVDLALSQLNTWRASSPGLHQTAMAVRLSASQVGEPHLRSDVDAALTAHDLMPSNLVLALTERALLQAAPATIATLDALRRDGVGVAVDNFGSGYSSLRYLATMPVTAIKVDEHFTAGLPDSVDSVAVTQAFAALAAAMGLTCIVNDDAVSDQRVTPLRDGSGR